LASERIARLHAFMQARPQDPFPKYALALEHRNAGDHAQAWAVFERLLADHPDYTAGYLHAGNALVAAGRRDEAGTVWQKGIDVCRKQGDHHALGELESALASMATGTGST
jgi:tetratricopeptide (TPR) repeat protein